MPVSLRKTTPDDLDFVLEHENEKENACYVSQWTREEHLQFMNTDDLHYIAVDNDTNERVGYMIIRGLANGAPNKSAELMRLVAAIKGRGYGRQMLQCVKHVVFEELKMNRLWLDVVDDNARARHLYESEQFVYEGMLRQGQYFNGKFNNMCLYSIIADDRRKG
mmetsp:Transcript_26786/g.39735  ORF Transcript_26786/g.39735 Transcript_26786/m.39735 type:complete len:164 (+) Transcript_26786:71-562(+)